MQVGLKKLRFSTNIISLYLGMEMTQYRAMDLVTIEGKQETVPKLSNGAT